MDFRPMRRKRQELPQEECIKILENATAGVLCVLGEGGYPYGVPRLHRGSLFHCTEGSMSGEDRQRGNY